MASDFARSATSDMIELLAENGQQRFLVHRDILASLSKPFKEATVGVWKEATERKVVLGDWDESTVGRLVEFCYRGNYSYPNPEPIHRQTTPPVEECFNQKEPVYQEPKRPMTPHGESESNTNRPLTPLNDCIRSSLPPQPVLETDEIRLEQFDSTRYKYKKVLLSHAKVYALAHYKSIDVLCRLALRRLLMTLSILNPVQPYSHISSDIVECAKYVYENTDNLTRSEEPLRRVLSQFVALNFLALQTSEEFMGYMKVGGDFVCDVMPKVCRKFQDIENQLLRLEPRFVSNVIVKYKKSPSGGPANQIHVLGSRDGNICCKLAGRYVWLVPQYTVSANDACTSFEFQSSIPVGSCMKDITAGYSGSPYYLYPVRDGMKTRKITMVALLRSSKKVDTCASIEHGPFNGMTADMNDPNWNTTGEYLYVVWRSVNIT